MLISELGLLCRDPFGLVDSLALFLLYRYWYQAKIKRPASTLTAKNITTVAIATTEEELKELLLQCGLVHLALSSDETEVLLGVNPALNGLGPLWLVRSASVQTRSVEKLLLHRPVLFSYLNPCCNLKNSV